MSHWPPSQVAVPFWVVAQALHDPPHELTLVLSEHRPPQAWVPPGHVALHGLVAGMQASPQTCWFAGHAAPQDIPSHVALPPSGAAHGVHDEPHVAGLEFDTHAPAHTW
jgi:hypothetical protein